MAIDFNPLNLQMMVPKSTEVSQMQHQMNHQVNVQQDQQMMRQEREDEHKMQSVQRHDETEDGRINNDPDREGRQGGYGGRRRRGEEEEEIIEEEPRKTLDMARGTLLDLSI